MKQKRDIYLSKTAEAFRRRAEKRDGPDPYAKQRESNGMDVTPAVGKLAVALDARAKRRQKQKAALAERRRQEAAANRRS